MVLADASVFAVFVLLLGAMSVELPPIPRRQCTATNRLGERCKSYPILGGTVCVKHGGSAPHIKRAAYLKLLSIVDYAVAALQTVLENFLHGPACLACGRPMADPSPVIRAAQIVLDRTGFGPQSTLTVQIEAYDPPAATPEEMLRAALEMRERVDAIIATLTPPLALPAGELVLDVTPEPSAPEVEDPLPPRPTESATPVVPFPSRDAQR